LRLVINSSKTYINNSLSVKKRNDNFVDKIPTEICYEVPTEENPYIAKQIRYHGYDILELLQKRSYIDVVYLLFKGELPSNKQHDLLEKLMIGLCSPGVRHDATRAAMVTGAGKSEVVHILPISLAVLGGEHLGSTEVQQSIRFLKANINNCPTTVAIDVLKKFKSSEVENSNVVPGFGRIYDGVDQHTQKLAELLIKIDSNNQCLNWCNSFVSELNSQGYSWLATGLAAAVFVDLELDSRTGAGLFQLISAPGLLAHGLEKSMQPVTAMPFVNQKDYHIVEGSDDE